MERRICTKCNEEKELIEFPKDKTKPWYGGYDCYCKVCKRVNVKQNYQKNKDYKIAKVKKWQKENPNKVKEYGKKPNRKIYQKKWSKENPNKVKQYNKKHQLNSLIKRKLEGGYFCYRKQCFVYYIDKMSIEERKIASSFRDRIKKAIKLDRKSSFNLLGCSIKELKEYLQNQFLPEMNWGNWGKVWEIDHIKGCLNFELTDLSQQKECFHHTNLRPLFKTTKIAESFGYLNYIGNRNRPKIH